MYSLLLFSQLTTKPIPSCRTQLEQSGLNSASPEALPLKEALNTNPESKMRIVAVSGYAAVSALGSSGSTGSTILMEVHGSRQAGLRTREWPLARSSVVHGEDIALYPRLLA